MSDSMETLRAIFDPDQNMNYLFNSFGLEKSTNVTQTKDIKFVVNNKSHLSSSDVLRAVEQDEIFMAEFTEWTKYETWIYKIGVCMHEMQHEAVLERRNHQR